MKTTTQVFLYDSLRRGQFNHDQLGHSTFKGTCKTPNCFSLYDLGNFPAVCPTGSTSIIGEVYAIREATLNHLDSLERAPDWYQLKQIDTDCGKAWLYYLEQPLAGAKIISSGDWLNR